MRNLIKNEQSGRSMVEMLGVLAIIGVLSVGGISGYSKAMAKFKLTKAQDQLTMMIMNIRTAFVTSPGYPGLTNGLAADYGLVPSEMVVSSSKLINAFGGSTDVVAVVGGDGTTDGAFKITFSGLGRDACRSLATSDWGGDGLAGISVSEEKGGTRTATGSNVDHSASSLPLSLSAASASGKCSSDNDNEIAWVYF